MTESAHRLGHWLFEDNYTIEHRQFSDTDERVIIKHHYGWSSTNYVTIQIWTTMDSVWVEYYEDDIRRTRDVYDLADWIDSPTNLSSHAPNW